MALSSRAHAFSVEALVGRSAKRKVPDGGDEESGAGCRQSRRAPEAEKRPRAGAEGREAGVQVELQGSELWRRFHEIGTEMIITKAGRRMFPSVRVKVKGLEPLKQYYIAIDVVPVDSKRYRYVYHSSQWMVAGNTDHSCITPRLYIHPDSPCSGETWMRQIISFDRVKLTNNEMDDKGHVDHPAVHAQVQAPRPRYRPGFSLRPSADPVAAGRGGADLLLPGDRVHHRDGLPKPADHEAEDRQESLRQRFSGSREEQGGPGRAPGDLPVAAPPRPGLQGFRRRQPGWELQLFAGGLQRRDALSSQPPALSIVFASYVSLVSEQHRRVVPRDLPTQPQPAPLLQDLSYELLKTTVSHLSKPRKTGRHQPASCTPLHGGYAKTIFPRHNQSEKC
ncbi:T-box transcription factor TBX22 isoform 2-T2 [Theristicus caerulescens]